MQRKPVRFTDTALRALKPRADRYEVFEGNGFGVRVTPAGVLSFVFVYHHKGRSRRMTLGRYADPRAGASVPAVGALSLADARLAFAQAAAMVERGLDPAAEGIALKAANRAALTFGELAGRWLEEYSKPTKKSWEEDKRLLNSLILPEWRNRVAKEIRRADVLALLDKIVKHAPVSANRVLSLLSTLFNWSIPRDLVEFNPCSAIEKPTKEKRRTRALSEAEIWRFWHRLPEADMDEDTRNALRMILITAQRPIEVVTVEPDNHMKGDSWIIPGKLTKNSRDHFVWLSPLGRQTVQLQRRHKPSGIFLFPSRKGAKRSHITRRALSQALLKNRALLGLVDVTPHDLRRTASSKMTDLLSGAGGTNQSARFIVGQVLNHTDDSVTSVYDVYSYAREKRAALEAWGEYLARLIGRNSEPDGQPEV